MGAFCFQNITVRNNLVVKIDPPPPRNATTLIHQCVFLPTLGPVIPRCFLEERSGFISRLSGTRNVTAFTSSCRRDLSFKCHQKWSAVGLSWQADNEGRMVENSLTKGRPTCPLKKGNRITQVTSSPRETGEYESEWEVTSTTLRCKRIKRGETFEKCLARHLAL